jgi:hypothetical protein
MSFDWNTQSNHNNVANYQLSGLPFTTQVAGGSPVELPRVSRWVVLRAVGGPITVFFKSGNEANGFTIASGETTPRLELRCAKIYTNGDGAHKLHVIAGLTTCSVKTFISDTNFNYPDP